MLRLFTELLRDFLVRTGIVPLDRIFLDPPDQDFATGLPTPGLSLNVYLADLRENRKLRTAERRREPGPNGTVHETLYPAWVDAHYLISAWDASTNPSDRQRPLREQQLLAAVSAALLAGDPLTPSAVYAPPTDVELNALGLSPGSTAASTLAQARQDQLDQWPQEFQLPGLPYQVLPPEGFPKLSDFWTTMGQGSVWRPVVYLIANVPVAVVPSFDFPIVTMLTSVIGQTTDGQTQRLVAGTEEVFYQIGGQVTGPLRGRDGTVQMSVLPLANVLLRIAGDAAAGRLPQLVQDTRTDREGRYRFRFVGGFARTRLARVLPPYQVVVRYPGLQAQPLDVDFNPTSSFAYDVQMQAVP